MTDDRHGRFRRRVCLLVSAGLIAYGSGSWAGGPIPAWWLHQAACIGHYESTDGRASSNLYQFTASTWASVGGRGDPARAPRSEQTYRAWLLWQRHGWARDWPTTARACGLR